MTKIFEALLRRTEELFKAVDWAEDEWQSSAEIRDGFENVFNRSKLDDLLLDLLIEEGRVEKTEELRPGMKHPKVLYRAVRHSPPKT